jgi:CRISPR-associated protein Csm1
VDIEKESLIAGALLHDIGKVALRAGKSSKGKDHSEAGAEWAKSFSKEKTIRRELIECIRFHHGKNLKDSNLSGDSYAWIVYEADNIAAGTDRRNDPEGSDAGGAKFRQDRALESVFNVVLTSKKKEETKKAFSLKGTFEQETKIMLPELEVDNARVSTSEYAQIYEKFNKELSDGGVDFSKTGYVNSVINIMESLLAFVPSSTNTEEISDISLYDHSNLTACIASCMYDYFQENKIENYRELCFENNKKLRQEEIFLLVRADISGIQDFIYTISSKGALKSLRGRSFYLELMTEYIADEILNALSLSRSNILYTGGGGFYLLLPNTEKSLQVVKTMKKRVNDFFLERFSVNLYIEFGWNAACAEELMNNSENENDGMAPVYKKVSEMISKGKLSRYDQDQLKEIFTPKKPVNEERECRICGVSSKLIKNSEEQYECVTCNQLIKLGDKLVRSESEEVLVFEVCKDEQEGLSLPSYDGTQCVLKIDMLENVQKSVEDEKVIRVYSKNKYIAGLKSSTNIMVGDYSKMRGKNNRNKPVEFESLAKDSEGIHRIGVFRADIDNLGHLFSHGFRPEGKDKNLQTLGRYTAISRSLSYFFKSAINYIAMEADYSLVIVYSGGDDLFAVGAWDQIICFADDMREYFKRFSCDALSFSAGIGFFKHDYPIARMASEVGELESFSKRQEGKDSVSLFGTERMYSASDGNKVKKICRHIYSWQELKDVQALRDNITDWFCDKNDNNWGKAALYKILNLILEEGREGTGISIARLAYMLARMENKFTQSETEKEQYNAMRNCIFKNALNKKGRKMLATAIQMAAYMTRTKGDEHE